MLMNTYCRIKYIVDVSSLESHRRTAPVASLAISVGITFSLYSEVSGKNLGTKMDILFEVFMMFLGKSRHIMG
jgi:hypothetical protein